MGVPQLGVQAAGFRALAADLRHAADTTLWPHLRVAMKDVGELIARGARSRASWSSRIPSTIKVSATTKGVAVKAGGERAPHAAIFEKGGRHPVFGQDVWVDVPPRAFMVPSLEANLAGLDQAALRVLDEFAADAGFR